MQLIEFTPVAEFVDRFGIVRPIAPCSLLGREEFKERLVQLQSRLEGCSGDWQDLYDSDSVMRHLIQRSLTLNGIDSDWVTLAMVQQFLFDPGYLIQINFPVSPSPSADAEEVTAIDLIGMLAKQHGLESAIRMAQSVPASLLIEVASSQVKQPKPQKRRIGADDLDRLLSIPENQLQEVW